MTGSRISMREGVAIMYYICIVFKNVPLNFHSVHTFIYIYILYVIIVVIDCKIYESSLRVSFRCLNRFLFTRFSLSLSLFLYIYDQNFFSIFSFSSISHLFSKYIFCLYARIYNGTHAHTT